jgi:hypothetical protein
MHSRRRFRDFALLLPLTTSCQLWVDEYAADREDPVDVTELCDVEQSVFDVDLRLDSNDHLATLEEYYAEANPDLVEQFETVTRNFTELAPVRTATYLMGEAGAGKSFMMRRLVNAFPEEQTCDLSLAEVLAAPSDVLPTKRLPDLATIDESVTLNSLPGFVDPAAFSLPKFLDEQGCVVDGAVKPLLVFDGLDEIHTSSAHALLREVEQFLIDGGDSFVHIVALGRPEGFAPWFADPMRGDTTGRVVELLRLKTPMYLTAGDVEFRLREYLDFAEQLEDAEASGELGEWVDSVLKALKRYPFLRYSLSNLAVGNVVLQHTAPGMDESEYTLKSRIFEDLIARDAETHGRPGTGSRYDASYLQLLEQIAAKYANVNDKGEFTVSPKDALPLSSVTGEPLGEVLVTATLERSGLAYLASPTSTTKRFRFSPFWVHGYLAERYNERAAPKYDYRGCR